MALRRSVPFAVGDEGTPSSSTARALMAAAGLLHRRRVVDSDADAESEVGEQSGSSGPLV